MPLGTKAGTVGTKVGKWCKLGSYNEIYLSFQLEHFDSLSPCHWRPAGVNSFNTDLVIKGRFCALCPVASMAHLHSNCVEEAKAMGGERKKIRELLLTDDFQ